MKLNEIIIEGYLAFIVIHSKKYGAHYVTIDAKNVDKIKDYTWYVSYECYGTKKKPIVRSSENNRLHRFIMGNPKGLCVDHINGDTLLNTEENLRICTAKQNLENRNANANSVSGVRGVSPNKHKWEACLSHNYKKIYLGIFDTIEEAEEAVKKARLKYFTHNVPDRIN